jgi:hypothetical protein
MLKAKATIDGRDDKSIALQQKDKNNTESEQDAAHLETAQKIFQEMMEK